MRFLKASLLAVSGLLIFSSAMAEGQWYAGASFGTGEANEIGFEDIDDGSALSGTISDDDSAWKIFAGYTYNRYVSIEGGYVDLGEVSIDAISDGNGIAFDPGPVNASIATTGFSLAVVARMPVTEKFGLNAKIGYFAWEAEEKLSNSAFTDVANKVDGAEPTFGIGASYDFNDRFSIRLEYEKFTNIDEFDGSLLSLGAAINF